MKYNVLRYVAYSLEIIIFFVVQETVWNLFSVHSIVPIFLIPIAGMIAMFEKEEVSVCFGCLCGLLIDFGLNGKIGFNSFLFPIICWILSILCVDILQTNFITCTFTTIVCVIFVLSMNFTFTYAFKGIENLDYILLSKFLPRVLFTIIMCPLFYFFNKSLAINIKSQE